MVINLYFFVCHVISSIKQHLFVEHKNYTIPVIFVSIHSPWFGLNNVRKCERYCPTQANISILFLRLGFHKEDITSEYKLLGKRLQHTQNIKPNFIANYVIRLRGIMQLHLQQIFWSYTIVFSILILAIAEISCENEEQSLDESSNRFVRSIKATPLRWGKRNIEKRSTAEEEDGSSEELVGARETRSSPLR